MGMYYFCCNECQHCWHRRRGSHPRNYEAREYQAYLRQVKDKLDEHEQLVKTAHHLSAETGVPIEYIIRR